MSMTQLQSKRLRAANKVIQNTSRSGLVHAIGRYLMTRIMLFFVLAFAGSFAVLLAVYMHVKLDEVNPSPPVMAMLIFKAAVEVWCSCYAGYFIFLFLHYLSRVGKNQYLYEEVRKPARRAGLAVVYLCCNDLDRDCLESLCRTKTEHPFKVFVHDDSSDPAYQAYVEETARYIAGTYGIQLEILRRGTNDGGKPGALNYVLERLPRFFEWLLVCDNDSKATDPHWYQRIELMLSNPKLGCVQFRNVGETRPDMGWMQKLLAKSIDVFEVFVSPAEKYGWMTFFGHNAVLRISALREIGGFTPSEFADDIDIAVRMNLAGYHIRYRGDIEFNETHPDNYWAFRTRSYKWAYGCASVFKRWAWPIITSGKLGLHQKFFFFIFIGFYFTQLALLAYLFVAYLIMPLTVHEYTFSPFYSVLGGAMVVLLMYLPTLAFFLGNNRLREWPAFAAVVGLVYGSVDFISTRGVIDCFLKRKRQWIPTNTIRSNRPVPITAWAESIFGFTLLAVPFVTLPHLMYLPCSYLFAAKFMCSPLLYCVYISRERTPTVSESLQADLIGTSRRDANQQPVTIGQST